MLRENNRKKRAAGKAGARNGQALVEYALTVPLLLIFIVSTVNFGGLFFAWITVSNAVRAGAQYASMGSSYASYPAFGSLSAIRTLVQNESSALPHYSSGTNPVITVCEYNNGATPPATNWGTTTACGVTAPPADPELIATGSTTKYTTLAIDVTYTYTALIPTGFKFPGFNITLALPTTVHRRAVMRVLN